MAQLQTSESFADGQLVTGSRLNNIVGQATALGGFITEQTALTGAVEGTDSILIYADGGLKKTTINNLFSADTVDYKANSLETGLIQSPEGGTLDIKPIPDPINSNWGTITIGDPLLSGGYIVLSQTIGVDDVGIEIDASNILIEAGNKLTINCNDTRFNTDKSIKLPVGNNLQRPFLPVEGMFRCSSETKRLEFYNGTSWDTSATSSDLFLVTLSKEITLVGVADGANGWINAATTWQWETGANIQVPVNQKWDYVFHVRAVLTAGSWVQSDQTPTVTWHNNDFNVYLDNSLLTTVRMYTQVEGVEHNIFARVTISNSDTIVPKKLRVKFEKGLGTGVSRIENTQSKMLVSVTKRRVSDDAEINQIL